jgi:hypothetical protein
MEISNRVWWERKPCPSEYILEGRKRCVLTSFLGRYNQNFDDFLGGHAADQLDHLDLPSQCDVARVSGEEGGEDNSRCWCHRVVDRAGQFSVKPACPTESHDNHKKQSPAPCSALVTAHALLTPNCAGLGPRLPPFSPSRFDPHGQYERPSRRHGPRFWRRSNE